MQDLGKAQESLDSLMKLNIAAEQKVILSKLEHSFSEFDFNQCLELIDQLEQAS